MTNSTFGAITERASEVADSLTDGILSVLNKGGSANRKYPKLPNVTNAPNYRNGTWKDSQGYAFQVVRVTSNGEVKNIKEWQEFRLQINPQEMTQDEIFAVEVTPTFRGVVVEHHGTILKDITISGTTGVSPKRDMGGAVARTGRPILSAGHSGFEEFHELRSYFRTYVELKRSDSGEGGELRLIFKNFKDNESLYVEPQKFTMKRTASRAMLYDYNIVLKAVGVTSKKLKISHNRLGLISEASDYINTATELIAIGTQVINASVGIIRQVERDVSNTLLGPLRQINSALIALKGGQESIFGPFGLTRRFFENFNNELGRIESNFNDFLGRDTEDFNNATGRTATIVGDENRESTYSELRVLNGINKIKRGVLVLLSNNNLFAENVNDEAERISSFYSNINFVTPNSTRAITVLGTDTLQSIAARELGDPDRFKELAILNGLYFPYIDEAGGNGVLKPGDNILIPQLSSSSDTGVKKNKEYEITKLLTEAEKNLGVDIRLDKNNDLAISNVGDLDLIAGIDNMSQAILLRLALEPGSLQRHPEIGTGLQIGVKIRNAILAEMQNNIISSYESDLRVEAIPYLDIIQEGNTTKINMIIKLKDLEQPVPLPITLNAG